ncbi:MAG: transporter substrate-binding domain-containing protein [Oligoflexia bacterium]|nr:transporter substrate-binding domain-containing protein [Oligoflexia bacterium]
MRLFLVIASLLFFNSGFRPALAQNPDEVTIAWEEDPKPPYLLIDANKKLSGIAVDSIEEILKRNKIGFVHTIFPWKRCLQEIEKKQIDLVPNSSYKIERAQFAHFTKPLYATHLVFFYLKKEFPLPPVVSTIEDLKKLKIGGISGFNYEQYEGKISIDTGSSSREALISKLKSKRFDLALEQKEVVLHLKKEGKVDLEDVEMVPDAFKPKREFHILVIKNAKGLKLVKILDEGIEQLEKDGTATKIRQKYLGEGAK